MKYLVSSLFLFLFMPFISAQGTITGFTINPVNPTNTDTVYIYANLSFTSTACDLSDLSVTPGGSGIQATAHHCLGAGAAICNTIDTFKINPLANGNYNFNLSLTSGIAPAPCTAGIAPDDDSTFSFTVGQGGPSGLPDFSDSELIIHPNPFQNQIQLPSVPDGSYFNIISLSGQVVKMGRTKGNTINHLDDLPSGLYFLKLEMGDRTIVQKISKR
ncbi:MAG: T9SS type A sorting domain-containing protein [Crocinitomicaceae bacterium]